MILFDGARLRRDIRIDLDGGEARLLAGDITVFGRIARGERFGHGLLADRWKLRRDGRLLGADALRLDGEIAARLAHRSGEHTSELQTLMRRSYAVFCLKKKTPNERSRTMNCTCNPL